MKSCHHSSIHPPSLRCSPHPWISTSSFLILVLNIFMLPPSQPSSPRYPLSSFHSVHPLPSSHVSLLCPFSRLPFCPDFPFRLSRASFVLFPTLHPAFLVPSPSAQPPPAPPPRFPTVRGRYPVIKALPGCSMARITAQFPGAPTSEFKTGSYDDDGPRSIPTKA